MEREKGPLEDELSKIMLSRGLGDPTILESDVFGNAPAPPTGWEQILLRGQMTHMEMILRLAREIDERMPKPE